MPNPFLSRRRVAFAAVVSAGSLLVGPLLVGIAPASAHPKPPPASVDVRLIGMNDFHGNLQPPAGSSGRVTQSDGTTVDAGGAAYIATHVKQLEQAAKNSVVVSSGDNVGASPLASALFHDEPTIDFLNAMGVDASAAGNHEFDEGYKELLRMQFGGCNPTDGCVYEPKFKGAKFPILGSNVYFTNGRLALLPFTITFRGGQPIGIIGATLEDLPSVVTPAAIAGLKFGDEVAAIDRSSAILQRLGVKAQIVVMHQGDDTLGGGPNDCKLNPLSNLGSAIAKKITPNVDVVFSGHTHQQYNCVVTDPAGNPRPFIQGLSFGRIISTVDVKISTKTHDVIRSATVANNVIVTRTVTPDPTVAAIVDKAVSESAPIANRQVGTITADLVRAAAASGEEPIGDVIADAQLAATTTNGAQIAITNPGGIRADLTYASSTAGEGDGVVTYGEAFAVQPFSNIMQTITLTGAQLHAVLEQQWQPTEKRVLQISSTLHYTASDSAPAGSHVTNITVAGVPVTDTATYRVSVNNFLAAGGDGFTVFAAGTNLQGGPIDLDAFTAYLTAHPNLAPPAADRVTLIP